RGKAFEREFQLEDGAEASLEVRTAALECLSDSDGDVGILLDHLKARNKALRIAALRGLIAQKHPEAEALVLEKLQGSPTKVREGIEALPSIPSPAILEVVEKQVDGLFKKLKTSSLSDVNTLVQLLTAVAKSEPSDRAYRIAEQGVCQWGALRERLCQESWATVRKIDSLEKVLFPFFVRAKKREIVDPLITRFLVFESEYLALATIFSIEEPSVLLRKLKPKFKDPEFPEFLDFLFEEPPSGEFHFPESKEWSMDWLNLAIKHRPYMTNAMIYLFDWSPESIARALLKGKSDFYCDEALLCLASSPSEFAAIEKKVDMRNFRHRYDDRPLLDLFEALKKKDKGAAMVAASEIRAFLRSSRLGEILETSIKDHFS
ncbi:MAG: hypothetical protein AAF514_14995, partial [Verrucomicrobiota bacterium]